jgi:hypothetical protein
LIHPPQKGLWLAGGILIVVFLPFALLAYGVTGYFRLSSETRALRNSLLTSSDAAWQPRFAFNVGNLTLSALRAGLSHADIPSEGRAALQSLRGAEVAICQLPAAAEPPDRAVMLCAADRAMAARGWDRIVGVMDGRALVAAYLPRNAAPARPLKVCAVVFDGRELVVVGVRANLTPLLECLQSQPGRLLPHPRTEADPDSGKTRKPA